MSRLIPNLLPNTPDPGSGNGTGNGNGGSGNGNGKAKPPAPPPPTNPAPTGPSAGNNDGDGTDGGNSSSTTSGQTPNVPLFPQIIIPVNNNHAVGFQPISNQSWSNTQNTSVGCTPGNNGRAGNNRTVTRTSTSSVQRNYGCTVRLGYTKDDAERDIDYAITAAVDIIDDNPGFRLDLSLNF